MFSHSDIHANLHFFFYRRLWLDRSLELPRCVQALVVGILANGDDVAKNEPLHHEEQFSGVQNGQDGERDADNKENDDKYSTSCRPGRRGSVACNSWPDHESKLLRT